MVVHVPHSAFPDEAEPMEGYWIGKTVLTKRGGTEPVFTRPVASGSCLLGRDGLSEGHVCVLL